VIYGNFPKHSPERRAIVERVREFLPKLSDFSSKVEREAFKERKEKILLYIKDADQVGVTIVMGNAKIGAISQFSLPAGQNFRGATCPGATEFCESLCYAKSALFMMHEYKYFVNWAYVTLFPDHFSDIWKNAALTGVVRVHVGGDYFSPDYVALWSEIIRQRKYTRFYAYTRSWQNGKGNVRKEFIGPLRELAGLRNMRLVLSCDRETGVPPANLIPTSIRAWLAADDQDLPGENVELIFRDHSGMKATVAQMGGAPVCPIERSPKYRKIDGKITCQNCTFCFSTGHLMFGRRDDDPAMLNSFSGTNVEARAAAMFRGFWKPGGATMKGAAASSSDCVCGAEAPCVYCNTCAVCRCRCG
jgi:hypothetical protein